jgi:hypothetical protein
MREITDNEKAQALMNEIEALSNHNIFKGEYKDRGRVLLQKNFLDDMRSKIQEAVNADDSAATAANVEGNAINAVETALNRSIIGEKLNYDFLKFRLKCIKSNIDYAGWSLANEKAVFKNEIMTLFDKLNFLRCLYYYFPKRIKGILKDEAILSFLYTANDAYFNIQDAETKDERKAAVAAIETVENIKASFEAAQTMFHTVELEYDNIAKVRKQVALVLRAIEQKSRDSEDKSLFTEACRRLENERKVFEETIQSSENSAKTDELIKNLENAIHKAAKATEITIPSGTPYILDDSGIPKQSQSKKTEKLIKNPEDTLKVDVGVTTPSSTSETPDILDDSGISKESKSILTSMKEQKLLLASMVLSGGALIGYYFFSEDMDQNILCTVAYLGDITFTHLVASLCAITIVGAVAYEVYSTYKGLEASKVIVVNEL